jgi:hypothetical protein
MRTLVIVLAFGVGVGAGVGVAVALDTGRSTSTSGESLANTHPNAGLQLTGLVVQDGAVNGCGGEQIEVQVRDATGVVGRSFADSSLEGADCVFHFAVSSPRLDCYRLVIDGTEVGAYSDSVLSPSYNVGYIVSSTVYGDPSTGAPPQADADFSGC